MCIYKAFFFILLILLARISETLTGSPHIPSINICFDTVLHYQLIVIKG